MEIKSKELTMAKGQVEDLQRKENIWKIIHNNYIHKKLIKNKCTLKVWELRSCLVKRSWIIWEKVSREKWIMNTDDIEEQHYESPNCADAK